MKIYFDNFLLIDVRTKKGFLPNAIQDIEQSWDNHLGTAYIDDEENEWVFEATAKGAVKTDWNKYIEDIRSDKMEIRIGFLKDIEPTIEQKKLWLKFVEETKAKYGFTTLLSFAFRDLTKAVGSVFNKDYKGLWIGKTGDKAKLTPTCSILSANHYNYTFGIFPEWDKMSPKDVCASGKFMFSEVINKDNIDKYLYIF